MSGRINKAIILSFEQHLISSATIMANMPEFQEACSLIRQYCLQGKIGLHLNFTSGMPLTATASNCPRLCDAGGSWCPRRRVLRLTAEEAAALDLEINAQVQACEKNGITPTHWDSHHHMHTEFGITPVVIRAAKRMKVKGLRLGINCGAGREGASIPHRLAGMAYRTAYNTRVRLHGLARTVYFGDALDTVDILRTTEADTEVMVHPMLDAQGRLVDWDGKDLKARIEELHIPPAEMSSYAAL
ncbi:MAG: ChbG/HpnK family deacetylase [Acidobacteriota bacterium]|nr:ChbG/HpnK family deacetylase [Acidobacteriota bacterium]